MSRALILAVCVLASGVGGYLFAKRQTSAPTELACATSTRDDLQAKMDSLIRDLEKKDAKLTELNELIMKFLLVELGLKIKPEDLAQFTQREKSEAYYSVNNPKAPAPISQNSVSAGEQPVATRIDNSYYKYKNKRLFGIPRLFNNKQAVPSETLEPFSDISGQYIGLVTFADETEGPIDMSFNQFKNNSGQIERFGIAVTMKTATGRKIIDLPDPNSSKAQLLTFGDDSVPSVGDVHTGYVVAGDHHIAFAWPASSPDKERSGGRMLEGYYYFKGKPSAASKGHESGSLYLFRK